MNCRHLEGDGVVCMGAWHVVRMTEHHVAQLTGGDHQLMEIYTGRPLAVERCPDFVDRKLREQRQDTQKPSMRMV